MEARITQSVRRLSTSWTPEGWEFESGKGKYFLLSTIFISILKLTQTPIQCIMGACSPGVNRQEREADHSPAANAKVKVRGSIYPLLHKFSWRSA
jgi:hypothetical protein